MKSTGAGGPAVAEIAGGMDGTAEVRPGRALAVCLVAGGAVILCALPAAIALGAARPQVEQVATGLGGLAAVLGAVKTAAALYALAGRWWSEHAARLAAAPAVEPLLR